MESKVLANSASDEGVVDPRDGDARLLERRRLILRAVGATPVILTITAGQAVAGVGSDPSPTGASATGNVVDDPPPTPARQGAWWRSTVNSQRPGDWWQTMNDSGAGTTGGTTDGGTGN